MIKIINNAVITKCGECPRYKEARYWDTNDIFHDEMACDQDGTPVFVNPETIDKDCPLADVEVFSPPELYGYSTSDGKNYVTNLPISIDDIEKVIVVRKHSKGGE